jgi:inward rectifier potassium channel
MSARRKPREKSARVRLGAYEFTMKGVSRFDLRDPYHLAITLTWPQFLAALFALYLFVNTVFATLFWLVPGSVANARPGSFTDVLFFRETVGESHQGKISRESRGAD